MTFLYAGLGGLNQFYRLIFRLWKYNGLMQKAGQKAMNSHLIVTDIGLDRLSRV